MGGIHASESDGVAAGDGQDADLDAEARLDDGRDAMIREEQPTGGDDACGGGDGSGDWVDATAAQLASAAGPAPAAADRGSAGRVAAVPIGGGAQENPENYPWEDQNFVDRVRERVFRGQWDSWRGRSVAGSEEVVERAQLDAWQGFAYDILERKGAEREGLVAAAGGVVDGDEEGGS